MDGLHAVTTYGGGASAVLLPIGVLLGMAALTTLLSARLLRTGG
jgi:hypothetical protein